MLFQFIGASIVTGSTSQRSYKACREFDSIEEAIEALEERQVLYDSKQQIGFVPIAFERVDD